MARMTRRNWLAAAGVTTAAMGTSGLFAQEATPANKHNYNFKKISPRELIQQRHLPNVELITQDNQKVHFYTDLVKDRRVVIQFMFARCKDICPVITHHLVEVQRMLDGRVGRDIFFYSITLSPEEDSPRDLKAFAKKHGVGPGWTFLTGKPDDILLLRKSLGFFYNDPKEDADRNNHSGMVGWHRTSHALGNVRRWGRSQVDRYSCPYGDGCSSHGISEWDHAGRSGRARSNEGTYE